jgi:hypothetical protein
MEDKPVPLSPAELSIDLLNPRIPSKVSDQHEALRALAAQQKQKLLILAEHIVTHGRLNPVELPLVMRKGDGYVVLEGNRRLTALRALETPEIFVGAIAPKVLGDIRALSVKYRRSPVGEIYCMVVSSREEAQPWIDIRHLGEAGGAGVVPWGADEKARNSARLGGPVKLHTRLLDYMQDGGYLSQVERERIKTTNLERVLKSQVLKDALGIEAQKGGRFTIPDDEASTIRAVKLLLKKLTEESVGKFYSRDERDDWVEEFLTSVPPPAPSASTPSGQSPAAATAQTATAQAKGQATAPARSRIVRPRERLIPPQCLIRVKDARVRRIENELRELSLEDYPNAISVLFRVFIELSLDWFISQNPRATPPVKPVKPNPNNPSAPNKPSDPSLAQKIESVRDFLLGEGKLSKHDARPVSRACQRDSYLAPSIAMMNAYIHSFQMSPSPTDLRSNWDSLEPFIIAIWPR